MKNNRERPGDIFISNYDTKGFAYLDVSIIHTLAQSHIQRAGKGQLEGIKIRYNQKMTKFWYPRAVGILYP